METEIGSGVRHFFGPNTPDFLLKENELRRTGKQTLEWDLNDWKWDGDLFIATPLNSVPLDCGGRQLFPVGAGIPENTGYSNSSSSCSDEVGPGSDKGKRELEKKRRAVLVENDVLNNEAGSLTLKLGGVYPISEGEAANWDGKNGKKSKLQGTISNRAVCQVDDCRTDLSNAKDYHRRHKVCNMHSKASRALVGNVMQRFCQQCSRFHVLQEFDEGKRSCRRRLAGHNKRRRKTHPDSMGNGSPLNDERSSSYLLISLLRILSNVHSNSSDQAKGQNILSHLLGNLGSLSETFDGNNLSGLLQQSQDFPTVGTSIGTSSEAVPISNGPELPQNRIANDIALGGSLQTISLPKYPIKDIPPAKAYAPDSATGRTRLNNIDLNHVYNDSQECIEGIERFPPPANLRTASHDCSQGCHNSSPPRTSGNSDSASAQSLSSSSTDAQSRTDRIVFKLFGKDPSDFPLVLRAQVLDWLSHSPTDIESYIRPGCIILTIYLRLTESKWDELLYNLSSNLRKLLDVSNNSFWRTGWVYARVQHRIAFLYNGQVLLDTPLSLKGNKHCRISSIKPIAVSVSEKAHFMVKGYNLSQPTTRLLCGLEGQYLVQEATNDLVKATDTFQEHNELQCLSFACSIPNVYGRGFIEVEDLGLSSGFFPFIVAEQNVCSEVRMLENAIEEAEPPDDVHIEKMKSKKEALDFIHEIGWLLHRNHVRSRLGHNDPNSNGFPFTRFKWLMEFSMDHDWCAVVKKLLDVLFDGTVYAGEHPSVEHALLEMRLLHRAVQRNCRSQVELLLRYTLDKAGSGVKTRVGGGRDSFLFRPDDVGPAGLTPLHVAATLVGTENVLDALTEDPGSVGIEAWSSARDDTGFTPEDYARQRGHYSYIDMIQKKIKKKAEAGHVVVDIPGVLSGYNLSQKQMNGSNLAKVFTNFQIEKTEMKPFQQYCKLCDRQLAYNATRSSLVYRPAMLSMVAIAAVCVCVALLFKSSPEVLCIFSPFRWELLDYGTI